MVYSDDTDYVGIDRMGLLYGSSKNRINGMGNLGCCGRRRKFQVDLIYLSRKVLFCFFLQPDTQIRVVGYRRSIRNRESKVLYGRG